MSGPNEVAAVTLDFFNTLIFNRGGRGRGILIMEYLASEGFQPRPWKHQFLYDVFEIHQTEYSPSAPEALKDAHYVRLTERLFDCLDIPDTRENARRHAEAIWHILGPDQFDVFPEVPATLDRIRACGLPIAVISNWQRGLGHFLEELGLERKIDHALASAEFGRAKPDPAIFLEACRRLGVEPSCVLHVGDTVVDDCEGAEAAGMQVALLDRAGTANAGGRRVIRALAEIEGLLA